MVSFLNSIPTKDKTILAMDANGLADVIGTQHRSNTPPTYVQEKKTIDVVFCTSNIIEAMLACGITEFHRPITSDHTGILSLIHISEPTRP
eukprot:15335598-Ditylum_brightwellii.AAC.1